MRTTGTTSQQKNVVGEGAGMREGSDFGRDTSTGVHGKKVRRKKFKKNSNWRDQKEDLHEPVCISGTNSLRKNDVQKKQRVI